MKLSAVTGYGRGYGVCGSKNQSRKNVFEHTISLFDLYEVVLNVIVKLNHPFIWSWNNKIKNYHCRTESIVEKRI